MHATTRAIIGPRKCNLHSPYLCSFPVFQAICLLLGGMENLERYGVYYHLHSGIFIRAAFSRLGNCSMRLASFVVPCCAPLSGLPIHLLHDGSISLRCLSFTLQILHIICVFFSIAFRLAFSQFLYFGQASWAIFLRMRLLRH